LWEGRHRYPARSRGLARRHRCFFRLCALDRGLELARPTKLDVERAMAGNNLAEATLIGTYKKHKH
jgi:phosphatidylethanolamine-binding protein (PEBP) family uncharacterized protein